MTSGDVYQPFDQPKKRSKLPWILGIGCLGTIIVCAGIPGGCAYWAYNVAIKNPAVQSAREQVAQSPEVQAALGAPVEVASFPTGTNTSNQSFEYVFSVSGSKENGTVHITAEVDGDIRNWTVKELTVETESGTTIVLVGAGDDVDEVGKDEQVTEDSEP